MLELGGGEAVVLARMSRDPREAKLELRGATRRSDDGDKQWRRCRGVRSELLRERLSLLNLAPDIRIIYGHYGKCLLLALH